MDQSRVFNAWDKTFNPLLQAYGIPQSVDANEELDNYDQLIDILRENSNLHFPAFDDKNPSHLDPISTLSALRLRYKDSEPPPYIEPIERTRKLLESLEASRDHFNPSIPTAPVTLKRSAISGFDENSYEPNKPLRSAKNLYHETTRRQYKTRLCSFWRAGICKRGSSCWWAHGTEDQRIVPDTRKTTLCKNWLQGTCIYQDQPQNCVFAHGEDDLKKLNGRLFLCGKYQRGECIRGKDCPYAHSIGDLLSPLLSDDSIDIDSDKQISVEKGEGVPNIPFQDGINIIDKLRGFML